MVCWCNKEAKPFGETVVVASSKKKITITFKRVYSTG
jgi:hypothetical protein